MSSTATGPGPSVPPGPSRPTRRSCAFGPSRSTSARRLTTKRAVAAELAHHESGYILAGYLLALGLARHRRGRLSAADARAVAAVLALQPWFEWALHRFVLHLPPRTLAGASIDPGASHRGHHEVPDDVAGALLGWRYALSDGAGVALLGGLVGRAVGGVGRAGTRAATLSGAAAAEVGLLAYEWTHLLSHSGTTLRTRWYRGLRAAHLRHHYRDERANFGITSRLADRALGTAA